jgi:hypothetical protein
MIQSLNKCCFGAWAACNTVGFSWLSHLWNKKESKAWSRYFRLKSMHRWIVKRGYLLNVELLKVECVNRLLAACHHERHVKEADEQLARICNKKPASDYAVDSIGNEAEEYLIIPWSPSTRPTEWSGCNKATHPAGRRSTRRLSLNRHMMSKPPPWGDEDAFSWNNPEKSRRWLNWKTNLSTRIQHRDTITCGSRRCWRRKISRISYPSRIRLIHVEDWRGTIHTWLLDPIRKWDPITRQSTRIWRLVGYSEGRISYSRE